MVVSKVQALPERRRKWPRPRAVGAVERHLLGPLVARVGRGPQWRCMRCLRQVISIGPAQASGAVRGRATGREMGV